MTPEEARETLRKHRICTFHFIPKITVLLWDGDSLGICPKCELGAGKNCQAEIQQAIEVLRK